MVQQNYIQICIQQNFRSLNKIAFSVVADLPAIADTRSSVYTINFIVKKKKKN